MNLLLHALIVLLASGLTACYKTAPAQADMDAETRQKAVQVRAAADKETAALKEAAAEKTAADKEAAAKEAIAKESLPPAPAPAPPK